MLEFGKAYFEDVAYFNFEENDGIKAVFDNNKELKYMNEAELSSYILSRIEEIEQLMDMIKPIIHHEILLNAQTDKEIRDRYKVLKAELKKDANYVSLKKIRIQA